MSSKKIVRLIVVLVVLAAVGGGTGIFSDIGGIGATGSGSNSSEVDAGAAPADVVKTLDGLTVSPPGSMAGYSREKFPHWSDAQQSGWNTEPSCDTRDAALIRDGQNVQVGSGCRVSSGKWLDPYTNRTYTDPSDIDIDHIVPLANSWRSGSDSWDTAERERYANDPDVVLSVEDNANQEKGDKGPEAWKPPNQAEWCDYAKRWVQIKGKYDLSVNEQEKRTLVQMLNGCKGG